LATAAPRLSFHQVRELTRELLEAGSQDIYRELLQPVDQVVLEEVLHATSGNQAQAAERLGISRMTLRSKLKASRPTEAEEEE